MAYGPACGDPDATALLLARRQEHIATCQPPPAQRHSMQRVFRLLTGKKNVTSSLLACRETHDATCHCLLAEEDICLLQRFPLVGRGGDAFSASRQETRSMVCISESKGGSRNCVCPCGKAGDKLHGLHLGGQGGGTSCIWFVPATWQENRCMAGIMEISCIMYRLASNEKKLHCSAQMSCIVRSSASKQETRSGKQVSCILCASAGKEEISCNSKTSCNVCSLAGKEESQ